VERLPYTVAIAPGEGLVVRTGDVVMYIADASLSAAALITAVESVAEAEQPGGAVAERLAALALGADSATLPPFGVIAPTADGLLLLLRGNVIASVDDARELSGARAMTWVDEVLPSSARKVAIGGRSGLAPLPCSDLRAGVVPGGGFVLLPTGVTAKRATEPVAASDAVVRYSAVQSETAVFTGTMSPPSVPARAAPSETSTLAPVAGVLQAAGGAIYPLDRPYVIGRDPLADDAVRNAHASPIVVQNDQHVSRVHAYVTIDGGVYVRDASTPGGTFIAAPGAKSWTEIGSKPTRLEPGWSLRVGEWILTYRGT